jgi:hypothetical protein
VEKGKKCGINIVKACLLNSYKNTPPDFTAIIVCYPHHERTTKENIYKKSRLVISG